MKAEIQSAKRDLRRQVQARLHQFSAEQRRSGSHAVCKRLLEQPDWKQARIVLLFAPFREEPDIWPVISSALNAGKEVCLPKLNPAGFTYHASPVRDLDQDLEAGKFGILEPRHTSAAMALDRLDLVLVPGMAFDLHGRRLGRGKGFYDRLLADIPGIKCGVAFDEQIIEEIPTEPHDIKLDCIVTPTRWLQVKT